MARSVRKILVHGCCGCSSEKSDKRINHRRERQAVRAAIFRGDEVMPHYRSLSDPWDMGKDGKFYFGDMDVDSVAELSRK